MHTLFVTSEFSPFAKAGGLADAVASLAAALSRRGMTVSVLMPKYSSIDHRRQIAERRTLTVDFGRRTLGTAIERIELDGVDLYLLEYNDLYDRLGIYGPNPAEGYHDNATRFSFLSFSALALAATLDPTPEIIHSHDWPGALVQPLLSSERRHPALTDTVGVFSIHNLGHQGTFSSIDEDTIGLPPDEMRALHIGTPESINMLRSAIRYAARIVTVSPRYALEIQQPRFGFGLHREIQMRTRGVTGILNGIDLDTWNPSSDRHIEARFSVDDPSGKARNKEALQCEMGLSVEPDTPIIGMVTRLVGQKGIGPLFEPGHSLVYELCNDLPIQFVLLGSGEEWCEREIAHLTELLPNFRGIAGYDEPLAHRIEASVDFFLMPSLYEPCGLNQMYSMRYGTLPIVTRTGGLADTVDPESGFFIEEPTSEAIGDTVTRAIDAYFNDRDRIERMRSYAMQRDFGWDRSAAEYETVYLELVSGSNERLVSA